MNWKSIVLCIMLAHASSARADPIVFDNSSLAFRWFANATAAEGVAFDPTLAPASQPSAANTARSLGYGAGMGGGSNTIVGESISRRGTSIQLVRNTSATVVVSPIGPPIENIFFPLTAFQPGASVGPGANFANSGDIGYFAPALGHIPLIGSQVFVGFRATLADGLPHYGYIELHYLTGFFGEFGGGAPLTMYQPIRWAYESLPNTPITVVPGPGAGAALALGLAAATARRRR